VSAGTSAPRAPVNKWLISASVSFGTLAGTIDASIVDVALPQMRGAVGATIEQITWINTGFAIAAVLVMPLTGFLGRLFGQKRVYLASLLVFLLGSALCGTARSLEALVLYRVLQGLGAGALQPTEEAILRQTFPPEEQGMAMALFTMAVMLGPALGPTLGGYIVDHASWPWLFFVNVPVGLIGFVMVSRFVDEPDDIREANLAAAAEQKKNADYTGIVLMSVGLSLLTYVLEEGQRNDWFESRTIVVASIVSLLSLAAFVARELTAKAPAVDLRLFKDPAFLSGTLVGTVVYAVLVANLVLLPLFMQELLGFTATQAGFTLLPRVLVMLVITPIVGRLYNKVSPRLIVGVGAIALCLGAWLQSQYTLQSTSTQIVHAMLVQGVGFSCLSVPLATLALSRIPRHKLTDATGLDSLCRAMGGSLSLAVFATALTRATSSAQAALLTRLDPSRPAVMSQLSAIQGSLMAGGLDENGAQQAALQALGDQVAQQSAVLAFEKMFLLAGILIVAVLPLLFLLKVDRSPKGEKTEVHVEI
jgi:DHA2 family multidrug resistance protein